MLERNLSKNELTDLLTLNEQEIPSGVDKVNKNWENLWIWGLPYMTSSLHTCGWVKKSNNLVDII